MTKYIYSFIQFFILIWVHITVRCIFKCAKLYVGRTKSIEVNLITFQPLAAVANVALLVVTATVLSTDRFAESPDHLCSSYNK